MNKFAAVASLAAILAGCASPTLIPDEKLMISPSFQPPLEAVVGFAIAGVVAYYVVDPMAPNWEVKVDQIDETRVAISLRKKRFSAGGDGEALDIFRRRAQKISDDNGFSGYSILQYTEGIDSETTYARRISRGVIVLAKPS
jgi:hypothetical protein